MIWEDALPDLSNSNMFIYNTAWKKGEEVVTRIGELPELLFVNFEAREAVMRWVRTHRFEVRLQKESDNHALVQIIDPLRHTIYLPTLDLTAIFFGCSRELDTELHPALRSVKHIALSANVVVNHPFCVAAILSHLPELQTVSAVWGDLPVYDTQPEDEYYRNKRGWTVRTTDMRKLSRCRNGIFWADAGDMEEVDDVESCMKRAFEKLRCEANNVRLPESHFDEKKRLAVKLFPAIAIQT